jgi:BON domain-containing protein
VEVGVAIRGTGEGAFNSGDMDGETGTVREIFRFGQKIRGENVPSVPARYRGGPGGPTGRVVAALLRPASGEIWLRIRTSDAPWQRQVRTIPLNTDQPPTPTPESVELRGGIRVNCHDGYAGRLEGVALDTYAGLAQYIVVRVRNNVLADVDNPADPLFKLVEVGGQQIMLPPAWVVSSTHESSGFPFGSGSSRLMLDASAEQIAAGLMLRSDGALAAAIWEILDINPAIAPYTPRVQVLVHDGDVTLRGVLPSPRHRASAEQDVWHVPGVLAVHNEIAIGE